MKRPKYTLVENKLSQRTIAELWFATKDSKIDTSYENHSSNVDLKLNIPLKLQSNLKNGLCDKENESKDNDFVVSSQSSNESKLRQKIRKSLSTNSGPQEVPIQQVENALTANIAERQLNANNLSDCSFMKDELITDMYENIAGYEPIDMSHDLSGLLTDPKQISNVLLSSPIAGLEAVAKELLLDPLQDPLYLNENDRIEDSTMSLPTRNRTRSMSSNKFTCNSSDDEELDNSRKSESKNKETEGSLSNDLIMKLKLMTVHLQHEVPPQHKIENNAGSRTMNQQQIKEFETYGPLKRGSFTENEDEIIRKNWRNFCEIHKWDESIVQPFLNMRHNGKYYISDIKERKNFVRFLANGIPWRSLYSVYFRFRNLFSVTVGNGQYTKKEDKMIMSYMADASASVIANQCAEVARILKRKRHSVWQRFQILKKKCKFLSSKKRVSIDSENDDDHQSRQIKKKKLKRKKKNIPDQNKTIQQYLTDKKVYTRVKWTSPLVNKFIQTLKNVTSSDSVKDLKYKKIDANAWVKTEKSISINRKTLEHFWYNQLHLQLFCSEPIYLNDTKIKLIEYLNKNKNNNLREIPWEKVCLSFDGMTEEFLWKLFDHLIKHSQRKIQSTDLIDVVQYLHEFHIPELEAKRVDVVLPKLHFKGDKIIGIDKGAERKIPNRTCTDPLADIDEEINVCT